MTQPRGQVDWAGHGSCSTSAYSWAPSNTLQGVELGGHGLGKRCTWRKTPARFVSLKMSNGWCCKDGQASNASQQSSNNTHWRRGQERPCAFYWCAFFPQICSSWTFEIDAIGPPAAASAACGRLLPGFERLVPSEIGVRTFVEARRLQPRAMLAWRSAAAQKLRQRR